MLESNQCPHGRYLLFLSNLEKEAGTPIGDQTAELKDGTPAVDGEGEDDEELPVEVKSFFYDEWDFRAADYRPRWCRIVEYAVGEGSVQYYDQTLAKYASLVGQTRKQFEMLRPEMFRKKPTRPPALQAGIATHMQPVTGPAGVLA